MYKYVALVKLNFKGLLSTISMGNSKNKAKSASGIGALILMVALSIYISGIYSFMLGGILAPVGMLGIMPVLIAVIASLLSLFFTVFAASGIVFGGKDMDFMLSLPLSPFSVMLSKIMALYLENLVFSGFMMLAAGAAYLFYGGAGGVLFIIRLLITIVFLPILPTLLSMIIGYAIAWITGHLKRKALIMNFVYIAFFAGVMYFSLKINNMSQVLLENGDSINKVFSTWLLPFGLLRDGIYGNILSLIGFIAVTVLPFLIIVFLFSTQYKKILTALSSHSVRHNYKMSALKSRGQFSSLVKKEFGRFFGTPIYLFNTGIGAVMAIGGSVFACFKRDVIMEFLSTAGNIQFFPILALTLGFLCITIYPSCVSINLEGKTLWILKEAPIPVKTLLLAKLLPNAVLIWVTGIISTPLLTFAFGLNIVEAFALLILCFSTGIIISLSGLITNLIFPKMDAINDTMAIKQSSSALIAILVNFVLTGIGVGLFFLFHIFVLDYAICLILASVVLLALGYLMWVYLRATANRRILAL